MENPSIQFIADWLSNWLNSRVKPKTYNFMIPREMFEDMKSGTIYNVQANREDNSINLWPAYPHSPYDMPDTPAPELHPDLNLKTEDPSLLHWRDEQTRPMDSLPESGINKQIGVDKLKE